MESIRSLSFNCSNCGIEQSRYLPPGTKMTSCHRCGNLITISKLPKNRQRELPRGFNLPEMSPFPYENQNYDSDDYENFLNEEEEFNRFINEPITRTRGHSISRTNVFSSPTPMSSLNNNDNNRRPINIDLFQQIIDNEEQEMEDEFMEYMNNHHSVFSRIHLPEISTINLNSLITTPKPKLKKITMNKKLYCKNAKGKLECPTCCICLANMKLNEQVTKLKCNHLFHYACLDKWIQNKEECPFCRGKLS